MILYLHIRSSLLLAQPPAGSRYCQRQSTSWPRLQKERAMDDNHTWSQQTAKGLIYAHLVIIRVFAPFSEGGPFWMRKFADNIHDHSIQTATICSRMKLSILISKAHHLFTHHYHQHLDQPSKSTPRGSLTLCSGQIALNYPRPGKGSCDFQSARRICAFLISDKKCL